MEKFAQKVLWKLFASKWKVENGTEKCCVKYCVKMKLGATTSNSGFKKWLVLSFLVCKYSTGKLYIFTTNYKVVATS